MDKENVTNSCKEVDILAVSLKPSPVLKGSDAKRLLDEMSKPSNNKDLFKKCKELSLNFKEKK